MSSTLTKRKCASSSKPNACESRIRPEVASGSASDEVEEIEETSA
jgi:hypothetical protein